MIQQYYVQNFGFGTLAIGINNSVTSITMNSGHNFNLNTSYFFKLIIWDAITYPNPADDPNLEVVTANYSGTLNEYTITRAEENTTAVAHASGAACAMTITAGLFGNFIDPTPHGMAVFLTSGTFVAPTDQVFVSMVAAGGGSGNNAGGGGGGGASLINHRYVVTIGSSYTVTIGSGGLGYTGGGDGNGTDGGNTSFDALTVNGGKGGLGGEQPGGAGGLGSNMNASAAVGTWVQAGGNYYILPGGNGASGHNTPFQGGGGGGTFFGKGGDGSSSGTGGSPLANTGAGAGGGNGNGANGADGIVIVIW